MPGKELKQNHHPPCNRAFALRMMNPTSYAEDRISIFDKEIQPVVKKSIAKNISEYNNIVIEERPNFYREDSADTISFDDYDDATAVSLSPTNSTDTSFSEMELYDIDEIENETHHNGNFDMIRQHSSLDTYTRVKKGQHHSENVNGSELMFRSHSFADGFDGHFSRGSPARASMPVRLRTASIPPRDSQHLDGTTTLPGKHKGYRNEAMAYLQGKNGGKRLSSSKSSSGKQGVGTLARTHSLKGLKSERMSVGNRTAEKGKSPAATTAKVRVSETRSSQLRAKLHDSCGGQTASPRNASPFRPNSATRSGGKHRHLNSFEDESDSSSTVFSETDAYNPRNNPRGSNKHSPQGTSTKHMKVSSSRRRLPNEQRTTSPSYNNNNNNNNTHQQHSPKNQRTNSIPSNLSSQLFSQLAKNDTFSSKLSQLCTLISERHPGDFQILETLVEMQTAYEDRNELVKTTISGLREHIHTLEHKLAHSPSIPGLVIPLMRATNAFQNQLQSIMDSHGVLSHDVSIQFPESNRSDGREITMAEISAEANSVAKQIEQIGLNSSTASGNGVLNQINGNTQINGHAELQHVNGLYESNGHDSVNGHASELNETTKRVESNAYQSATTATTKNLQQENNYHNSYYHGSRRVTTDAATTAMTIDTVTM